MIEKITQENKNEKEQLPSSTMEQLLSTVRKLESISSQTALAVSNLALQLSNFQTEQANANQRVLKQLNRGMGSRIIGY